MIDFARELVHSGKELICADDELLFIALQHNCRLARSKGRPALDSIGFSSKNNLLPGTVPLKFYMIVLRINLFHNRVFITHSQSKRKSRRWVTCVKLTSATAENTVGRPKDQTCELR
jgi:hypothetical protein